MSFHLGKPILVMLVVAAVCGTAISLRRAPSEKKLKFWVFADSHYLSYLPEIAEYEKTSGVSVDLQIVQSAALSRRLQADFADQLTGPSVPDLVEIEVGQIGKFFRPPLTEVGFEPLRPRLERSGWYSQIVQSRFAPWTKEGVIFGVPHDVHPVGIAYRQDLFDQAGIDLSSAHDWTDYQQRCLLFQQYWSNHGYPTRHAVECSAAKVDLLLVMLLQRHINLIDDFNHVHLADRKVAETVAFYAQCVVGPNRIGSESGEGEGPLKQDLLEGNLCAFMAADWRIGLLKEFGGDSLRGKLRFMQLPRFDSTDAPTASWGGTMVGILRSSAHKDEAWKLIEHLYFDRRSIEARRKITEILPPVKTFWSDPSYHQPDPYFGGQHLDEMLIELAGELPPRYATPATNLASFYLMQVLNKATQYVESQGTGGLVVACQRWLDDAAVDLATRMKQWEFQDSPQASVNP